MDRTLELHQIYFKDEQKEKLYPFSIPFKNETITDYFENQVIADLVPNSQADLIAVCSWRLAQKRGDTIFQLKDVSLSKEKILSHEFDVAVLTPRSNRHQPLFMASQWHGKAWDDAFTVFRNEFFPTVGIKIKSELTKAIYENHFIAKREIYHQYVETCLKPAMEFVKDKPVFYADSGYIRKKRDQKEIIEYQQKSGRHDWVILPFILERLFSCWIEGRGYNVINL